MTTQTTIRFMYTDLESPAESLDASPGFEDWGKQKPASKNVFHDGQLKLFVGTLAFMLDHVDHSEPADIVMPGGGSHSRNIGVIAEMYPQHTFWLYDPVPPAFPARRNIKYKRGLFTTEDARRFAGLESRKYMVSDIRSWKEGQDHEVAVDVDNQLQAEWVRAMRADCAMIKFRVPFTVSDIPGAEYTAPAGRLMLQAFAGAESTETRLVVDKADAGRTMEIVGSRYNQRLVYHNRRTRTALLSGKPPAAGARPSVAALMCATRTAEALVGMRTQKGAFVQNFDAACFAAVIREYAIQSDKDPDAVLGMVLAGVGPPASRTQRRR